MLNIVVSSKKIKIYAFKYDLLGMIYFKNISIKNN